MEENWVDPNLIQIEEEDIPAVPTIEDAISAAQALPIPVEQPTLPTLVSPPALAPAPLDSTPAPILGFTPAPFVAPKVQPASIQKAPVVEDEPVDINIGVPQKQAPKYNLAAPVTKPSEILPQNLNKPVDPGVSAQFDYNMAVKQAQAPLSVDINTSAQELNLANQNYTTAEQNAKTTLDAYNTSTENFNSINNEVVALEAIKKPTPEQKKLLEEKRSQRQVAKADWESKKNAAQQAENAVGVARQDLNTKRSTHDTNMAVAEGERASRETDLSVASTVLANKRIDDQTLKEQAELDKINERDAKARKQLEEDRKAYRKMLEDGPETTGKSIAFSIAAALAEGLQARLERRPPNFDKAFQSIEKMVEEPYKRKLEARLDGMQEITDNLQRSSAEKAVITAETQAKKAAILDRMERELNIQIAQSRSPMDAAAKITLRDDIRVKKEAAERQAMVANQEAEAKLAESRAKTGLVLAQTDKAMAEAAKARGEIRGAGGGGSGGNNVPEGQAGLSPLSVYLPGSDTPILSFSKDTPQNRKAVEEAQAIIAAQGPALDTLNDVIRQVDDYGVKHAGDYTGFTKSPEWTTLTTDLTFLRSNVETALAGQFSPTAVHEKAAASIVKEPTAWSGGKETAEANAKAIRARMENQVRYNLQKAGLTQAQINKVISESRQRARSQRKIAEEEYNKSYDILTGADYDETKKTGYTVDRKLAAIDNRIEYHKKQNPKGKWWLPALQDLSQAMINTENTDVDDELSRRIKELRKINMTYVEPEDEETPEERSERIKKENDRNLAISGSGSKN